MYYLGKPISGIPFHRKCAPALLSALNEIWVASGKNQKVVDEWGVSDFGGSFNYRLMRNSQHLSMHSYGIAIDLSPARFPNGSNQNHFNDTVVKAFEKNGAINLPNDLMHFQFATVN